MFCLKEHLIPLKKVAKCVQNNIINQINFADIEESRPDHRLKMLSSNLFWMRQKLRWWNFNLTIHSFPGYQKQIIDKENKVNFFQNTLLCLINIETLLHVFSKAYSEPSQKSMMETFAKIVLSPHVNCFQKKFRLTCLTEFWVYLFW